MIKNLICIGYEIGYEALRNWVRNLCIQKYLCSKLLNNFHETFRNVKMLCKYNKTLKHIFYDDQKIEKGFYKNEAGKNGNKEEK